MTVPELRQRFATAISALTSPDTWRESAWAYDTFPLAEPGQYAHLAFAVGIPSTSFGPMEGSRRRLATGGLVESVVGIRWVHHVRGECVVADTDAAYDAEAILVKAISAMSLIDLSSLSVVQLRRQMVGDGTWLLCEATVEVHHQYQLI